MRLDKKNKVAFFVPTEVGISPGQRFRFEQYLDILEVSYNITPVIYPFWSKRHFSQLYSGNIIVKIIGVVFGFFKRVFHLIKTIPKSKIVFIYREVTPIGPPIFEWVLAKIFFKKIIYDFDDAIWMPLTSKSNSIAKYFKFHHKVGMICNWSYKVSVGNHFLAKYAEKYNANIIINPTTIDTINLHNQVKKHKDNSVITIGWTGTHSNFIYLKVVIPSIIKLQTEYNIKFIIIANQNPQLKGVLYEYKKWNKDSEIDDLLEFDVGIMPLDEKLSELSKGKCGFKALQYMALGIPPVISPVGINKELIEEGVNGYLASTKEEWFDKMLILVEEVNMRKKIGSMGRKFIDDNYSVLSNSKNFSSLFLLKEQ